VSRSAIALFAFTLALLTQLMAPETLMGQTLLFQSGFESSTKLSPVPAGAVGPTGNNQLFNDTDLSTAFPFVHTIPILLCSILFLRTDRVQRTY
jgi:hypothetical protein